MPIEIFLLVLAAALMHVLWNSLIRQHDDKSRIMLWIVMAQGLVGLPIALWHSLPDPTFWGWIAVSTVIHVFYQFFLMQAYRFGDLSRVYPIARGAAPMMVLMASPLIFSEILRLNETMGIIVIGTGIVLLSLGAWRQQETLRLIPLALASAACTAAYSIVDALGARLMGDAILYKSWVMILDALIWLGFIALFHQQKLVATRSLVGFGLVGGVISFTAYAMVLWAMTQAPVSLVAALRETSVLFALLVGVMFFKERLDLSKILAAILIMTGVALTRFIA